MATIKPTLTAPVGRLAWAASCPSRPRRSAAARPPPSHPSRESRVDPRTSGRPSRGRGRGAMRRLERAGWPLRPSVTGLVLPNGRGREPGTFSWRPTRCSACSPAWSSDCSPQALSFAADRHDQIEHRPQPGATSLHAHAAAQASGCDRLLNATRPEAEFDCAPSGLVIDVFQRAAPWVNSQHRDGKGGQPSERPAGRRGTPGRRDGPARHLREREAPQRLDPQAVDRRTTSASSPTPTANAATSP